MRKKPIQMIFDYTSSSDMDLEDLALLDIIDLEDLQTIQDTFAKTNDVASIITDTDGKPITKPSNFCKICQIVRSTEIGKRRCERSDMILGEKAKKLMGPTYERCHSLGLIDASAPIIIGGKHVANWLIGQTNVKEINSKLIEEYAREIGADVDKMLDAYHDVHHMSIEKFENVLLLLSQFAKQISTLGYNNLRLIRELNERKLAEERLRESEAKLRTVVDTIPDLVWLKNTDGVYLICNSKFERFFGAKEAEIVGKTDYDFVEKELADFFTQKDKAAIGSDRPVMNEEEVVYADDGHREVLETINNPMYDSNGNLVGVLGIGRDITSHKIAEETLLQAKIEAELANRFKNEFIAIVSHELKTPLSSIIGFSEFLLDEMSGGMNEEQVKYINDIFKSGNHLLEVVNSILDISMIESGKIELYYELFSVSDAIDEVISILLPLALKKSIDIDVKIEMQLEDINADKTKFKQILYNLASNAIKFTPENGSVMLTGKQIDNMLQICVEDTGMGIPKENLEEIFNPFKQGYPYLTRIHGGTGLGLSIAKNFVELHNGSIWVESEVGKGSTFTFAIPI
ncbi:PocR ligand-binding domain-containing protein [Methanolobus sp. ZRKC3]|uniref:PocR ligand-binding domain-containing protein n=1 Tax=Methanolobus sp. ZRKC3 TaxID=3125786 RepID=UPI00324ED4BE